jgi:hypothetical protein
MSHLRSILLGFIFYTIFKEVCEVMADDNLSAGGGPGYRSKDARTRAGGSQRRTGGQDAA